MKPRVLRACLVALLLVVSVLAHAQKKTEPEDIDLRTARSKEGKMFTVTLRPFAKKVEVDVVGNRVADLEMSKVGLKAEFRLGSQVFHISPKRMGKTFSMDLPEKASSPGSLILKVNSGKKVEEFNFDMPAQP